MMDESDVIRARDVRTGRTLGEQFLESQFTRIESPDARIDLAEESPLAEMRVERGPIRYPRPDDRAQQRSAAERLGRQVYDAAAIPVYISVGDGSQTLIGTYDAAGGRENLARLLRIIADRLMQ